MFQLERKVIKTKERMFIVYQNTKVQECVALSSKLFGAQWYWSTMVLERNAIGAQSY